MSGMKSWRTRELGTVIESLKEGDVIITPELSRLGRSLVEILELLNICKDKGVSVYSVKEAFKLNGDGCKQK